MAPRSYKEAEEYTLYSDCHQLTTILLCEKGIMDIKKLIMGIKMKITFYYLFMPLNF